MKFFLKLIVGFFVLVAGGVGLVFFLTGDMVESVDTFFLNVQEKNMETAYQGLSKAFQDSTDVQQLESFLKKTGLSEFQSASWSSRSIDGGVGSLEGSVSTVSGSTIPLEVQLVKEAGAWKIQHLNRPAVGISDENTSQVASRATAPKTSMWSFRRRTASCRASRARARS